MYEINDMPSQVAAEDLETLSRAETGTIGHFRFHGFASPRIGLITPEPRTVVGTAVTLMLPALDSTLLHHAVGLLREGDFLVIDRLGDRRHACLGGSVAYSIWKMGVAGVIVDGPCADPHELRQYDMPIWARGYSAVTTRLLDIWGGMNLPMSCGGAVVRPGDAVLADENGVLFLRQDEVVSVATRAIELQDLEKAVMPSIGRSMPIGDVSGATALVDAALSKDKN